MTAQTDSEARAAGSEPSSGQVRKERSVRWVYLWLLFSSLLTVPWMARNLVAHSARADSNLSWSPDGTHIAFVSDRDGNDETYVMNADGSDLTDLTHNVARDHSPAWSPDGAHIAFASYRDGNDGIYVMNADGSDVSRLTPATTNADYPAWSPDGARLAFVSYRDDGNSDIYVMNADGSDLTDLTHNVARDHSPAWSPDGTHIAFYRVYGKIYVMNADGSGQTNLTHNVARDYSPAWSPDGARMAFVSDRDGSDEIYVMNADGSGQTNLTHNTTYDDRPAWSPDGTRIAFRRDYGEIYVMNADGSGQTNLTHNTSGGTIDTPRWSPDGAHIAFGCGDEICVMDRDGTNVRNLSAAPLGEYVAAVAWPGLVHVVLLIPLWSRNLYVRRHAQQAFLLAVARVLSTVLIVGITCGALIGLWVMVNGGLWIFGTVWGLRQIKRGDCWLMRRRGEMSKLPRPWATAKAPEPARVAPGPAIAPGVMPAEQGERAATVEELRAAFHTGSPEERQRAIEALKALGELEEF